MVSDRHRIDGFLQGARSLQLLGLHHILLLSLTQQECERINAVVPEVGCGWTSFESPQDLSGVFEMWNLRYRTVARYSMSFCRTACEHAQLEYDPAVEHLWHRLVTGALCIYSLQPEQFCAKLLLQ